MEYKHAILILDNLRLVKIKTKDEVLNMVSDLIQEKIPFQVLKNHGEIWSFMDNYVL